MTMYPFSVQYPSADDFVTYLRASGMLKGLPAEGIPTFDILGYALASAIGEWERLTKYQPFVADTQPGARLFDSPLGGILDLAGGIVGDVSVSIGGAAYTAGTQFVTGPANAAARGLPTTYLDFGSSGAFQGYGFSYGNSFGFQSGGGRNSVSVTGLWGFCAVLPPDVRQVILQQAAAVLAPSLSMSRYGGLISWTEAGVTENYGQRQFGDIADAGTKAFQVAALRYRRVSFGG